MILRDTERKYWLEINKAVTFLKEDFRAGFLLSDRWLNASVGMIHLIICRFKLVIAHILLPKPRFKDHA